MLIRIINVDPNNHGAFKYINNTLKRIGYGCELVENESKNEEKVLVNTQLEEQPKMSLKTFTLTFVGLLTTFVVLFAQKTIFSLIPLCLFALFLWYSAGLVKSDD